MPSTCKKIIVATAILKTMFLLSASDYIDKSFPPKSYVYAPHREAYLLNKEKDKEQKKEKSCFFCIINEEGERRESILIKSFEFFNVVLNEYPYNKGHLLISPKKHVASLEDLNLEEKLELLHIISISVSALQKALDADGFNIGINMGKCGGASIPQHLHIHIVPRYLEEHLNQGFVRTISKTTIISWDIGKLAALLRKHFNKKPQHHSQG